MQHNTTIIYIKVVVVVVQWENLIKIYPEVLNKLLEEKNVDKMLKNKKK